MLRNGGVAQRRGLSPERLALIALYGSLSWESYSLATERILRQFDWRQMRGAIIACRPT